MNRTLLTLIVFGTTVLVALLDFATSAALAGSALFVFPLSLCVLQRSKWLLWATMVIATLLTVGAGIWSFHRVQILNPLIASANRGLLITSLLTLTILIHLWINKSQKAVLESAEMERHSNSLSARIAQLENELAKIKALAKGKGKSLVLTIKQYQAFAAQLSELHRTMVVTVMCTELRVSEVLALKWDQVDFASGRIFVQQEFMNGGVDDATPGASRGQTPMDPVLVEALLDWRNKTPGTGLVFPSRITGRCYLPGPIQQDYFRPAARKLGLVGVSWHTFPGSYRTWMDEDASGVQQKLMRHVDVSSVASIRGKAPLKAKPKKGKSKAAHPALPKVAFEKETAFPTKRSESENGVSANGTELFEPRQSLG
jgi:integrase